MEHLINKIAEIYSVTPADVEREMRTAIAVGMSSEDPDAREFWRKYFPDGKEPSAEAVIGVLVHMVRTQLIR